MWFQIEVTGKNTYRIHFRWWHPAFLIEVYRSLRECGATRFETLWLMTRVIPRLWRKQ